MISQKISKEREITQHVAGAAGAGAAAVVLIPKQCFQGSCAESPTTKAAVLTLADTITRVPVGHTRGVARNASPLSGHTCACPGKP